MSDQTPLPDVSAPVFDRVWAIMTELGEQQRHFNTLQSHYRTMASTWLLGSIAAIGLVYSNDVVLPIKPELAVATLSVAAAFGIVLLWMLDILVYHELLVANYEVAKEYEQRYEWLPQVHAMYSRLRNGPPVRVRASRFYIGSAQLLFLIAAAATYQYYGTVLKRPNAAIVAAVVLAAIAVFGGLGMMLYVRRKAIVS